MRLCSQLRNVDILKVAHHGSKYSTCDEFLDAIQPKIALISAGKNSPYGHPHVETIERLSNHQAKTFVTRDCGAVTLTFYTNKYKAKRFT